jgi:hypothetical protein
MLQAFSDTRKWTKMDLLGEIFSKENGRDSYFL